MASFLRLSFKKDPFFAFALLSGVVLTAAALIFHQPMYRDVSSVYSHMVRELLRGNLAIGLHPSIPPLNVCCAAAWCRIFGLGEFKALIAVSSLFAVLTLFPLRVLLRRFLPERWAGFGCLLFIFAPKLIRSFSSGTLESGKIFFSVLAVALILGLWERGRGWWHAAGFGAALGGLSLARGEGIGNAAVLLASAAVYLWFVSPVSGRRMPPVRAALLLLLAVTVWGVVTMPRMVQNYRVCGYPVPDQRIVLGLRWMFSPAASSSATEDDGAESAVLPMRERLLDAVDDFARGSYELYLIFTVAGILLTTYSARVPRLWPGEVPGFCRFQRGFWLLLAYVAANAAIHGVSISAYRYFLVNIPLLMVFTVTGVCFSFAWVRRLLPEPWPRVVAAAALLAVLSGQLVNGWARLSWRPAPARVAAERFRSYPELPGGGVTDRTRLLFRYEAEFWFYSGMRRVREIEDYTPFELESCADFDYAVFNLREEPELVAHYRSRGDVRELKLPFDSERSFFRLKRPEVTRGEESR